MNCDCRPVISQSQGNQIEQQVIYKAADTQGQPTAPQVKNSDRAASEQFEEKLRDMKVILLEVAFPLLTPIETTNTFLPKTTCNFFSKSKNCVAKGRIVFSIAFFDFLFFRWVVYCSLGERF